MSRRAHNWLRLGAVALLAGAALAHPARHAASKAEVAAAHRSTPALRTPATLSVTLAGRSGENR